MRLLFEGGDYSRAATIRGRCLLEEVQYSSYGQDDAGLKELRVS